MTLKIKVGSDMSDDDEGDDKTPVSGWVQMWHTLGWVVFVLACFSYCCRREIVEILQ